MDEIDAALGNLRSNLLPSYILESFNSLFFPGIAINFHGSHGVPDFKNVSIVGHYVKDRTKDAQFIIIR